MFCRPLSLVNTVHVQPEAHCSAIGRLASAMQLLTMQLLTATRPAGSRFLMRSTTNTDSMHASGTAAQLLTAATSHAADAEEGTASCC